MKTLNAFYAGEIAEEIHLRDKTISEIYAKSSIEYWLTDWSIDDSIVPIYAIPYYVGADKDLRSPKGLEEIDSAGEIMNLLDEVLFGKGVVEGDEVWIIFDK